MLSFIYPQDQVPSELLLVELHERVSINPEKEQTLGFLDALHDIDWDSNLSWGYMHSAAWSFQVNK